MRDPIDDPLSEQLSALADGELSREELPLLLARLDESPERRARLARYYLARDGLQRATGEGIDLGLADRVRDALRDEPAHRPSRRPLPGSHYLRPAAGLALAASVALVGVLVWPGAGVDEGGVPVAQDGAGAQVAALPDVSPDLIGDVPSPPAERPAAASGGEAALAGRSFQGGPLLSPAADGDLPAPSRQGFSAITQGEWDTLEGSQDPLRSYMINHAEHASTGRMGGVLNYVRITGNESARD
ncbi:sigma-E factor negative regulatory protein [Alkalilimnicola ehrlichii MLHE-1]|uniref:Anti sigma-E protein, RseA n=1 Tax=Alkalilimnicola ehrlichii (strain ATCC BAA-1101 / DSM 17681 / MLHE-1) TaxID=187272 RepID=Q0A8Z8_ALKEH|nr:sigma-E factor negative regulatory protein [Alkalilimnicola ehrlichii]ABI56689.1 anti sigma-E protein, RseA [Alkalilimnicola ehrlichii MLHE-1]